MDQITDFECPICFDEFNHVNKKPKTVNPCAHTICEECVPNVNYCPKCRAHVTGSTIAYSLLGAIEQFSRERLELIELRVKAETQRTQNEENTKRLEELQLQLAKQHSLRENQEQKRIVELEAQIAQMLNQRQFENTKEKIEELQTQIALLKSKEESHSKQFLKFGVAIRDTVFVRGLPKTVSKNDIFKWIFKSNGNIIGGCDGIGLKMAGEKQNCIVTYNNTNDVAKVIEEWNEQAYPGTENVLQVDYLRDKMKRNNALPKVDKTKIFICGLPQSIGVNELKKWIFRNNEKLIERSIKLLTSGNDQICNAQFTDEIETKKLIDDWNEKEYPGTSKVLRVEYYIPRDQPKPRQQAAELSNKQNGRFKGAKHNHNNREENKAAKANLKKGISKENPTKNDSKENEKKADSKVGSKRNNSKPDKSRRQGSSKKGDSNNDPTQCEVKLKETTSIIVKNLPYTVTKVDIISLFHRKSIDGKLIMIESNENGQKDFICFFKVDPSTAMRHNGCCKITFTTADAANLAIKEFNGKKFPATYRQMFCELWWKHASLPKTISPTPSPSASSLSISSTSTAIPNEKYGVKVLVEGLPATVTLTDLISVFHPVSKILHDENGVPKVEMLQAGVAAFRGKAAKLEFENLEEAKKIVNKFDCTYYPQSTSFIYVGIFLKIVCLMVSGLPVFGSRTIRTGMRTVKRPNKQWFNRLFIILIGCCLLGYLLVYWYLTEGVIVDSYVEKIAPQESVDQLVGHHQVTIEEVCSPSTKRCYSVIDRLVEKRGTETFVERCLFVVGFDDESDSSVRLIPPAGEKFESSDTRLWTIDHRRITAEYVAAMAISPFVFGAFDLTNKNEKKSLLEIGLGGGLFDSFIRLHRPNINITSIELDGQVVTLAEKWFGLKTDNLMKVVTDDGVRFVEKAAMKGLNWDMILLDACDTSSDMPCPAADFLNDVFIANLAKIVNSHGIVLVNILDLHSNEQNIGRVARQFASHFPTCAALHVSAEFNVVLVCLPYEIGDAEEQLQFFEHRIPHVLKEMDLQDVIKSVVISAPYKRKI
ncbi:unnamed protein product, partial [Mesorhabditis belari]|uniref:Uncharacterized protein n=1 Tax=Mesorhabditis belari TaxID=2138241 RepID=A0AAF3F7E8_9BILA